VFGMDVEVQCNLWSDQRSILLRLENRIIESQKHLFLKTEKIIKSQNEKIVKLTKLVDDQSERIGTFDARLEIVYRFLNKEMKDMEGRILSSMETMSSSFTNQLVYSFPYALSPAMTALGHIVQNVEILCNRADPDRSNLAASDVDVVHSDPANNSEAQDNIVSDPISEVSEMDLNIEYAESNNNTMHVKSEESTLDDEKSEAKSNIMPMQIPSNTIISNNNEIATSNGSSSGLNFIMRSLGLPGNESICNKDEHIAMKTDSAIAQEKNLKRKMVKCVNKQDACDSGGSRSVGKVELDSAHAPQINDVDLEDGEILDDEQEVPVVPIGRVTVKTSGLFKDEVIQRKKQKRPNKCRKRR